MNKKRFNFLVLTFLIFIIFLLSLVFAVSFKAGLETQYTGFEDVLFTHNFSDDVTDFSGTVTYYIDEEGGINSTNPLHSDFNVSDFYWISMNETNGNFTINSSLDNETGRFEISIKALEGGAGSVKLFNFTINATNDAPNFTIISDSYTLSQGILFNEYLNASDEEEHYPLFFNVSFLSDNCSHADWSGRNINENCSLFDFNFSLNSISNGQIFL